MSWLIHFLDCLADFEKSVVEKGSTGAIIALVVCNLFFALGVLYAIILLSGWVGVT